MQPYASQTCAEEELAPAVRRRHDYAKGDLVAGRYLLREPVGEGGMGCVWHARDTLLERSVALKVLRSHRSVFGVQRAHCSERLTREASTLSLIRHPAVVSVLDFGAPARNDPYVSMELLEGESLAALLGRSIRLAPEYAVQILLPIAHGLAAVHDLGVVHRDLKPDNIFLAIDGRMQPKLIDFGLVKVRPSQSDRKLSGMGILGTPDYMSPEQALELTDVDARADVWAFCVVLYEALSGQLPFGSASFIDTLCAIVRREPRPLTEFDVDPTLWAIVQRGLRKEPVERWQSMRDLGSALASWLVQRGVAVDVTGACVHAEWQLAPEASRRESQEEEVREEQPPVTHPVLPGRATARPSLVRAACRSTVALAAALAIMSAPDARSLIEEVTVWVGGRPAKREARSPAMSRSPEVRVALP